MENNLSITDTNSIEDLFKYLEENNFNDDLEKIGFIAKFLGNNNRHEINADELIRIIKQPIIKDTNKDSYLISTFLESNDGKKIGIGDLFRIFQETELPNDIKKLHILQKFFEINNEEEFNINQLFDTPDEGGIIFATSILLSRLEDKNKISQLIKNIFTHPKSGNLKYNYDEIIGLYLNANHNNNLDIEDIKLISDLAFTIHSNSEVAQVAFFLALIQSTDLAGEYIINHDNVNYLGIEKISSDDLVREFLAHIQDSMTEIQTLKLFQNRTSIKYSFLKDAITDRGMKECLTGVGFEDVKDFFIKDFLEKNQDRGLDENEVKNEIENILTNTTISSLFSYWDIANNLQTLSERLSPEFKSHLQDKLFFFPPETSLFIKPEEVKKLYHLINHEELGDSISDLNQEAERFIPNTILCDYFSNKINFSSITTEYAEHYQLDFQDTELELSEQNQLNELFKNLLKSIIKSKIGETINFNNQEASHIAAYLVLINTGNPDVKDKLLNSSIGYKVGKIIEDATKKIIEEKAKEEEAKKEKIVEESPLKKDFIKGQKRVRSEPSSATKTHSSSKLEDNESEKGSDDLNLSF